MNKKENIQVIHCRTKTKNRKNQMHALPCCQNGKGIAKTCLSITKKSAYYQSERFQNRSTVYIFTSLNGSIKVKR
jgi:hypothetical protein